MKRSWMVGAMHITVCDTGCIIIIVIIVVVLVTIVDTHVDSDIAEIVPICRHRWRTVVDISTPRGLREQ